MPIILLIFQIILTNGKLWRELNVSGVEMKDILNLMKSKQLEEGPPNNELRANRINRLINALIQNEAKIIAAIAQDFSARPKEITQIADIGAAIGSLKYALKNIGKWTKPSKRPTSPALLGLIGASAKVEYQPKGVVGVISPWNFPIFLAFGPLGQILAAGNRAMIKPSELTPATSELMKAMIEAAFAPDEIAVITGGVEIGQAFSELPFDHLLYTGSTNVGRHIMAAAAKNLVPVTLELGGKSPVIVSKSADLDVLAARVANGKSMNAGQICLAPDYLLVPEENQSAIVDKLVAKVSQMHPKILDSDEYTAIINNRHFERLKGLVNDAKSKGAKIVEINPAQEDFGAQNTRKMPITILTDVTDDMRIMQEEIFGPLLPIKTYKSFDETINYINSKDRPLALYYFGDNEAEKQIAMTKTTSGGVTINDVIFHIAMEDLPFGGIGASGMGAYHGHEGFLSFSHAKSTYSQLKKDIGPLQLLRPPYGAGIAKYIRGLIRA